MFEINGLIILADIKDVLEELQFELMARGIPLLEKVKQSGRNIMVTCPNHAEGRESRPSCGVSMERYVDSHGETPAGTAHCFTCGYTATITELVSFCFGKQDFGLSGFKWIVQNFHNVEFEHKRVTGLEFSREKPKPKKREFVKEDELAKYRFTHPYMYERLLTDKVIDYFDIGYDAETNCLTFPVQDKKGNVLFVQRRSVGTKFFQFQEDDPKGDTLYGIYQVYNNLSWIKKLWVVESPICALTLWGERKPAVATMGALPTREHLALLKELPVRELILAQDNDIAGEAGRLKSQKSLMNLKSLYRPVWPDGIKDINEFAKNLHISIDCLELVLL